MSDLTLWQALQQANLVEGDQPRDTQPHWSSRFLLGMVGWIAALFLLFFLLVFSVHWLLRSNAPRKHVLLAASLFFYGCWDWRFLALIVAVTGVAVLLGVAIAVVIELLGGLALLIGFRTRYAALALAVFTLVASFFFHAYWSLPAEQQMMQQLMFFKNIAITGGLLAFAAFGPGAFSIDGRRTAA